MCAQHDRITTVMVIGVAVAAACVPLVLPAATNTPPAHPAVAAAEWQKLFAEEAWYKNQRGSETNFSGTLEAVQPPMASTLMRTSLYKLGGRSIYTGPRRVPALDALTGKQVVIRGKAVDMALEGQTVREIWPAAVRAAN
jgi:hypothetical protein